MSLVCSPVQEAIINKNVIACSYSDDTLTGHPSQVPEARDDVPLDFKSSSQKVILL